MQFIPEHWLELAAWHPGLMVYAREIPEPRAIVLSPESSPKKWKVPSPLTIRPAA